MSNLDHSDEEPICTPIEYIPVYEDWIKANVVDSFRTCLETTAKMVTVFPELRRARGYYHCVVHNREFPHWWCVTADGKIVDPTRAQFFPCGIYEELEDEEIPTGSCLNCGDRCYDHKTMCSTRCHDAYVRYLVGEL